MTRSPRCPDSGTSLTVSRAVSSLTGVGGAFSVRAPSNQGHPCLRNSFSESQRQNLAQPPWSPTTAGMDLDTGPLGVGAREGLHFKFPQFCTAWESVWKAGKCRTQWESPPDSPHTGPAAPPEASAPGSEPLPDQCLRGATSARLSHRKLARPGGSLSPAPCGAAPPTPGRGTSELARPRERASRPVAPGLGAGSGRGDS